MIWANSLTQRQQNNPDYERQYQPYGAYGESATGRDHVTDIVGFSRQMGRNEARTLRLLTPITTSLEY